MMFSAWIKVLGNRTLSSKVQVIKNVSIFRAQAAQIQTFHFLPGPGGFPQEFQAGFNAWFMDKTFDVDGLPQFFPTIVLNQIREDHLQFYAMQGVFGLGVTHYV